MRPRERGGSSVFGGGKVSTADLRLGAFVRHLFNPRLGGTREPSTYALGAITPRPQEPRVEPGPHPPSLQFPLTR